MRVAPDTNVLARAMLDDHPEQSAVAKSWLAGAERLAIGSTVLCELVWVLSRAAKIDRGEIVRAIEALTASEDVVVDREAVAAGLRHARRGGDFADGVIGHEARRMGAERLATFDARAAQIMRDLGEPADLLV